MKFLNNLIIINLYLTHLSHPSHKTRIFSWDLKKMLVQQTKLGNVTQVPNDEKLEIWRKKL
ncbi:MAG: hypothetical protein ACTSPY_10220 [Candidatus Helarchaeota archaeon]